MKFYDCATAPSPRRVRIFLAEKGMEVSVQEVDLRNREQLSSAFREINPFCTVPVLELDDGTRISEASAICRYLEEIRPQPPLMGIDAADRAVVAMWDHRVEMDLFLAGAEALRNSVPRLENRALTGPVDYAQIPALAERGRARVEHFFSLLEGRLGEAEYIAGERFSVADISALVGVDFAAWVKLEIADDQVNLKRWYADISARPACRV